MYTAKPTKEQLVWQDMELGVLIHYLMEIYNPQISDYKSMAVRTELAPDIINPTKLDPEQWVRSAKKLGAKYAVLVANHCTGFSLWPTKENDYCTSSLKWRDGKGDICREFIDACKKYDIRPGFYYSTGCNGYYGIDDGKGNPEFYKSEQYQDYVKHVEAQVKELWTEYGELFEIWFDGGVIPPEQGGPDLVPILKKYQPQAICFQGPKDHINNVRWVGNEAGLAPENCWAPTVTGDSFDHFTNGDPDGDYYCPAETDMPNRTAAAFGGGWAWRKDEEQFRYTPEQLLDCYVRSVGRNSNLLLGMAISADGDFQDEEQFEKFGELIKKTFSNPIAISENPTLTDGSVTLNFSFGRTPKYLVVREDITEGQKIRKFRVSAGGRPFYESECVGHKRIIPLRTLGVCNLTFTVLESDGEAKLRDIAIY